MTEPKKLTPAQLEFLHDNDLILDERMRAIVTQTVDHIRLLEKESARLRELLWLRHGCGVSALYGDDGERQCSACIIDFKRATACEIERRFIAYASGKGEQ